MRSIFIAAIALVAGLLLGFLISEFTTPTTTSPHITQTTSTSQCPVSVETIKKEGGTDATWSPWEWVRGGTIVWWDIDIARELGVELEIRDIRFAGLLEAVRRGDVDIAISAITWTTEREKVLEFSMLL
ncbi:MAG: transporter substrate-binding domain-containing protein [Pyrobaculum sp.]